MTATTAELRARIAARVLITDAGCWEWQGSRKPNGYGEMTIDQRRKYAHRVSYEIHVGPIPDGFQIDHLCRNRACANPAHLEPVTQRTNTLRGAHRSAVTIRTGQCHRGHRMTPANTIVNRTRGTRRCRTCHNAGCAARRARLRAAA